MAYQSFIGFMPDAPDLDACGLRFRGRVLAWFLALQPDERPHPQVTTPQPQRSPPSGFFYVQGERMARKKKSPHTVRSRQGLTVCGLVGHQDQS